MKHTFYTFITLTALMLFGKNVFAGTVEVNQRLYATPAGPPVAVNDNITVDVSPKTGAFADAEVENLVTFAVDHNFATYYSTAKDVKVFLKIQRWDASLAALPTLYTQLEVKYHPFDTLTYRDKHAFRFLNSYRYTVTIDTIQVNGVNDTILQKNLYLDCDTKVTRWYTFSDATTTSNLLVTPATIDCDTSKDVLNITWTATTGAEEYHLEWTYVNDYGTTTGTYLAASAVTYTFDNATRITTTNTNYQIPVLFDHGYVIFRIRPMGRHSSDPTLVKPGTWTTGVTYSGLVSAISSANYYYKVTNPHEGDKNWQLTTTFAEEGKKKEVVSYFDGSLRNRQTVTRINSDNNTIVGQTIYDYQGRPAITVLPVPAEACTTGEETKIKYYPEFNQNDDDDAFTVLDFDLDDNGDTCTSSLDTMGTNSGASKYYSTNNTNKTGIQAFVPDAEGFPFAQVEYTPDNTGRIRRQGGVGPEFQLGSGHETFYFYGSPEQIELDRLFGSEVGDAAHYKKNMVRDPNGQYSVSYLDQEGRVIATALAGDTTNNLIGLPSADTSEVSNMISDLFAKDGNGNSQFNKINVTEDGIEFSKTILVSSTGTYDFDYTLTIDSLADECLDAGVCFTCVYELDIKVTDDCGINKALISSQPIDDTLGHFTINGNGELELTFACDTPSEKTYTRSFSAVLEPGNYTVSKILKINHAARTEYINAYLDTANNDCVLTLQDFIDSVMADVDTSGCYITCDDCVESLGSKDAFVAAGKGTAAQWDVLYEQCMAPCEKKSLCEATYQQLLVDVSPQGQYGQYDNTTGIQGNFPVSVYNTTNELPANQASPYGHWKKPKTKINGTDYLYYVDVDGTRSRIPVTGTAGNYVPDVDNDALVFYDSDENYYYTWPENLTEVHDFLINWKDSWAQSLVQYHPEYAYYTACAAYGVTINSNDEFTSDSFDALMESSETFQDAVDNGFIDATGLVSYATDPNLMNRIFDWKDTANTADDHAWDPFLYYTSYYGGTYSADLYAAMTNYWPKTTSGYWNIVEYASLTARCGLNFGTNPDSVCLNFGRTYSPDPSVTDSIRDLEWTNLKSYYRSLKQKFQKERDEAEAMADNSYNGCIGEQNWTAFGTPLFGGYTYPSFYSQPYYDIDQPCSFWTHAYYLGKQKRFHPYDVLDNQSANNIAYQLYLQTGQCPNAANLKSLLGVLAGNNKLDNSAVQLNVYPEWNAMFMSLNDYTPSVALWNYYWQSAASGSDIRNITITNSGNTTTYYNIQLDKTGASISNWDDIEGFTDLLYTTTSGTLHSFTAYAKVKVGSNYVYKPVTGNTDMPITGCQFEYVCEPNDFATDIAELMSVLAVNGNLDGVAVNIEGTNYDEYVTDNIRNMLGTPNTALRWTHQLTGGLHEFKIYDNTSATKYLLFTITSTDPSGYAWNKIDTLKYFTGMRSDYNNFFVAEGYNRFGVKQVDWKGNARLVNGATTTNVKMGECEHPDPVACTGNEYTLTEQMFSFYEYMFETADVSVSHDIFTNPYLSDLAKYYLLPDTISTSVYTDDTIGSQFYDTLHVILDHCDFWFVHSNTMGSALQLHNVSSVISMQVIGDPDEYGNYHDFYLLANFSVSGAPAVRDTIFGTSCLPLKPCYTCADTAAAAISDSPLGLSGFATDGEEGEEENMFMMSMMEEDGQEDAYQDYLAAIDSLNTRMGWDDEDSLYITPMGQTQFVNNGYGLSMNTYYSYLNNYQHGVDNYAYLNDPGLFVLEYGNMNNAEKEYQRYTIAMALYNQRCDVAGIARMTPVTDSVFYYNSLGDSVYMYIDQLQNFPAGVTSSQDVMTYLNSSMYNMTDTCYSLYTQYVTSWLNFDGVRDSIGPCPGKGTIWPLYTYGDFLQNNLCCSNTGYIIIGNYLTLFTDTSYFCPEALPFLESCNATHPEENNTVAQQYYIGYQEIIEDYNASEHSDSTGTTLTNEFDNYTEFIEVGGGGHFAEYSAYIGELIGGGEGEAMSMSMFIVEDSSAAWPVDECDSAYAKYLQVRLDYNSAANTLGLPVNHVIIDQGAFIVDQYCYCVDAYESYLYGLITGSVAYNVADSNTVDDRVEEGFFESCETSLLPPCTPEVVPDTLTFPTIEDENPCVAQILALAEENAGIMYQHYIDSLTAYIGNRYTQHCLSAFEQFDMEYDLNEYHYTLYYYDQAGNLVRTVPPQGVNVLELTSSYNTLSQQIADDRANNTHTVFTNHYMATTYEYNSLNQLVAQNMPDHDQMDIWETTLPNGLHKDLIVTQTQFVSASKGYLSGYINQSSTTRGFLYSTNDGGASWTKVEGLTGVDLKKVQMINDTGYAVGSDGILLRTFDNGANWDLLNTYNGQQSITALNDLHFLRGNQGVIVGDKGVILYTVNAGNSFTAINYSGKSATVDNVVGVTYTGSVFIAVYNKTTAGNPQFRIARSGVAPYTATWVAESSFETNNLKDVNFSGNYYATIVGEDGTMLRRTKITSGWHWEVVNTGKYKNITKTYMLNDDEGVALIDSIAGYGQLYKTTDGGLSWELLSRPGDYYNNFYHYYTSSNLKKLVAVGKNKLVARVVLTAGMPYGITKITGPNSTPELTACWAKRLPNGKAWAILGNSSGQLYYCDDIETSGAPQYTTGATISGGGVKHIRLKAFNSGSGTAFSGNIINSVDKSTAFFRNTSGTVSTASYTGTSGASYTHPSSDIDTVNNMLYLWDNQVDRIYYCTLNGSSISSALTQLSTSSGSNFTARAMDFQGDTAWVVGDGGEIRRAKFTVTLGVPTVSWSDEQNDILAAEICGVTWDAANSVAYASGINGNIWKRPAANSWVLTATGSSDKLNAIHVTGSNAGYIAGNTGLYSFSVSSNTVTLTSSYATSVALRDVTTSGTKLYAVGDEGTVLYTPVYGSTAVTALTPNTNEDLYGIGFNSAGTKAFAVGNNSRINLVNTSYQLRIKNLWTPRMNDVSFYDELHGYALGRSYTLRYTDDGGLTWQPVLPTTNIGSGLTLAKCVKARSTNTAVVGGRARYYNITGTSSVELGVASIGLTTGDTINDIAFYGDTIYLAIDANSTGRLRRGVGSIPSFTTLTSFTSKPCKALWMMNNGSVFVVGTDLFAYRTPSNSTTTQITTTENFRDIFFHDNVAGYAVGESGAAYKTTNFGYNATNGNTTLGTLTAMNTDDNLNGQTTHTNMTINAIAFATRHDGFMGGLYAGTPINYARRIHDEAGEYSTKFWYDKLGRIVLSQNTRQYNVHATNKKYSYTKYDALGRVVQAGELTEDGTGVQHDAIFGSYVSSYYNPNTIDDDNLEDFIADNTRSEVTTTFYDEQVAGVLSTLPNNFDQDNLRKRISTVMYEETFDNDTSTYDYATHYSYDIHGNVKTLVQDNKELATNAPGTDLPEQQNKRIDYTYDLISGNVNQVDYQKDSVDAFHHRYEYDADNRITDVETSVDEVLWDNDASYFYYAHGPLARTEIGDNQVQATDDVYTLQGWIKGVNSNTLNEARDPGQDGKIATTNVNFGRDVYGYSLGYFTNDYKPIDYTNKWSTTTDRFEASLTSSDLLSDRYNLYDGNIGSMVTTITDPSTGNVLPMGNAYKYDQLNRILESRSYDNINTGTNSWNSGSTYANKYNNRFTYDANGNILTQKRYNDAGTQIENLTYKYAKVGNEVLQNRLYHLNETISSGTFSDDIDDMGTFDADLADINTNNNYSYDEEGRLTKDSQEQISSVIWREDGKIKEVNRTGGSSKKNLKFDYDAMGQRIAKHIYTSANVWERTVYYVRDNEGNVMATYEKNSTDYNLTEHDIYGSSRLGMRTDEFDVLGATTDQYFERVLDKKQYELSNHLGNVLAVVTDQKVPYDTGDYDSNNDGTNDASSSSGGADGVTDFYKATILASQDYSPFGVILSARNFSSQTYKYGFNGKEKDNEIKNDGNSYDFGARIYDNRIGRFLSVDPLVSSFVSESSYGFCGNSPIQMLDNDGERRVKYTTTMKKDGTETVIKLTFNTNRPWKFRLKETATGKSQPFKFKTTERHRKQNKLAMGLLKENYSNVIDESAKDVQILKKEFCGFTVSEILTETTKQNDDFKIQIVGNHKISGKATIRSNGEINKTNTFKRLGDDGETDYAYYETGTASGGVYHLWDDPDNDGTTFEGNIKQVPEWVNMQIRFTKERAETVKSEFFGDGSRIIASSRNEIGSNPTKKVRYKGMTLQPMGQDKVGISIFLISDKKSEKQEKVVERRKF